MRKYRKYKKKRWHDRRANKIGLKPKRNKKYDPNKIPLYKRVDVQLIQAKPVIAPENICLFKNTNACLNFFDKLRSKKSISKVRNMCFVQMDISNVKKFDYSAICVLIAIIEELRKQKIYLRGNYPNNKKCKHLIIESGLLTFMYDEKGKRFNKSEKSDLLFIQTGKKELDKKENIHISETIKSVVKHLTGKSNHLQKLKTILLEICGNSIEWGGTNQWLLGVKYDDNKAIFTITDVGAGILSTLHRKLKINYFEMFLSQMMKY